MRESKSFASLSSGLLARKGAAKPAMRPQGFGGFGTSLEDLGWNDMGQPDEPEFEAEPAPRPMVALTPSVARVAPEPPVVVQQRALQEAFAEPELQPEPQAQPEPASVLNLPRRRGEVKTGKAKAAFTLRLDPQRHMKLRLACALGRVSAQQLVTGALDKYLESLPELEALADYVPAETGSQSR
jgi:hypothetical protein